MDCLPPRPEEPPVTRINLLLSRGISVFGLKDMDLLDILGVYTKGEEELVCSCPPRIG